MKVALLNIPLVVVDPEICGGAERMALQEVEGLGRLGIDAKYYVLAFKGSDPRVEPMFSAPPVKGVGRDYYQWFCERSSGADIQHSVNAPLLALVSRHPRIVIHIHNATTLPYYELAGQNYNRCHFLCCSKFIRGDFLKNNPGVPEDRCHLLYNGIDAGLFSPGADRHETQVPRVVFSGAWNRHKGIFVLLEAFRELERAGIEFEGVIAGSPYIYRTPTQHDWQIEADRMVREKVGRLGKVRIVTVNRYASMPDLFRSSDICAFPSTWQEPFGLGAIEAMACSLPVVASKVGALPEIVDDGNTGFLVDPGDHLALAESLTKLIESPSLRLSMGEKARRRVLEIFSIENHLKGLASFYESIL